MIKPAFDEHERSTTDFDAIIISYTGDIKTDTYHSIISKYMTEVEKRSFSKVVKRKSIRLVIQILENIRKYGRKSHHSTPFHISIYDDVNGLEIRANHFLTIEVSNHINSFIGQLDQNESTEYSKFFFKALEENNEDELGLWNLARLAPNLQLSVVPGDKNKSILELKIIIKES